MCEENVDRINDMLNSYEGTAVPDSIDEFAAQSAARTLAEHWAQAFKEGWTVGYFLDDVDKTCAHLKRWAREVAQQVKENKL